MTTISCCILYFWNLLWNFRRNIHCLCIFDFLVWCGRFSMKLVKHWQLLSFSNFDRSIPCWSIENIWSTKIIKERLKFINMTLLVGFVQPLHVWIHHQVFVSNGPSMERHEFFHFTLFFIKRRKKWELIARYLHYLILHMVQGRVLV